MIDDRFADYPDTPALPAVSASEVVPDDDADLAQVSTAINVATPGAVRVTTRAGDIIDVFVAAGSVFPLRVRKVWATGTTATGIRALY
jgi:hypothetical protein